MTKKPPPRVRLIRVAVGRYMTRGWPVPLTLVAALLSHGIYIRDLEEVLDYAPEIPW
jgi:hypothetical protein